MHIKLDNQNQSTKKKANSTGSATASVASVAPNTINNKLSLIVSGGDTRGISGVGGAP